MCLKNLRHTAKASLTQLKTFQYPAMDADHKQIEFFQLKVKITMDSQLSLGNC